ncbi:UDP-arabinose 4-epimerase, partial [Sarracenia purpurea var. burkii]
QVHEGPITSWGMRRAQLVVASRTDVPMGYHDPYMLWYRRVTRLLLTNPSHRQAPGYLGAGGIIEELTQCVAYTYQEADTWLRGHSPRDTAFQTVLGIRDRCYTSLLAVHKEHCLQPPQAPSTTQQSSPSSPSVGPLASMTVGPHSPHSVIPIVTSTVAPQLQFLSPASGPSSSILSSSAVPSLHRDFLDITHGVSQSQLPQVPPLPVRGRGRGRGRGRARARGRDLPQVPSVAVSQEVDPSEVL